MKIFLLFIALLGLLAIGKAKDATKFVAVPHQGSDDRIINGEKAEPGEIPYQVLLNMDYLGKPEICGGSLIRPNWVLTAAHCIVGNETLVLMGGTNQNTMTYKEYAVQRIVHEDYSDHRSPINDVALLRLRSAPSGPGIGVVELAPEDMESLEGKIVRVSGFGRTKTLNAEYSADLLKANVKVIRNDECQRQYKPNTIKSTNLCTVGSTRPTVESACRGDSGGPLVYNADGKDVLVGVVSFGSIISCNENPAVFTRISSYRKWIDATMAKYAE